MQCFPQQSSRFMLTGPAGQLEVATELPQDAANITFVMCHPHPLYQGTMDNKVVTMTTAAFKSIGLATVRFNYRGVGKSTGSYGEGIGETEDLFAILDWLKTTRPGPVWLGGFSFGGYVAYRAAGLRTEIQQLLTIAPGVTRFDMAGLPEPSMPWVVVQGEADEVIPPQAVYDWLEGIKAPYRLYKLPNVGHFFHGELLTLKNLLAEHYRETVTQ
jgi:alpha/beta superfamily hydrolase